MEQDATLVARAIAAVEGAPHLGGALDALVSVLLPRFELWNATLCSQLVGATEFTVLASWSLSEGLTEPQIDVSTTISETVRLMLETLWEGRAATFAVGTDPDSLVDHLLREQGVASVLALPVHRDPDKALLMLTLGSSAQDAFHNAEKGFFTELCRGISDSILRLTAPASS